MRAENAVDVNEILKRKTGAKKANESLRRGTKNIIFAAVVFAERKYAIVNSLFGDHQLFISFIELLIILIFCLNFLVNFVQFCRLTLGLHPVIITSDQARLLKISSEQTPGVTIGCSPSLPVDQGSPSIPSTSSNRFYSSFSPSSIWSFSTPQV
jgi:hypothetical protein